MTYRAANRRDRLLRRSCDAVRVVAVRKLRPDDWELFRDIRLRALRDCPDAFGSTLAREQRFTEEDWRRQLSGPTVVIEDPDPVSVGGTFDRDGLAHVWGMWTDPAHRRRGHAHRVLSALLAPGQNAVLHVNIDNFAARGVYERYGFEGTGVLEPLRPGSEQQIELMVLAPSCSRSLANPNDEG